MLDLKDIRLFREFMRRLQRVLNEQSRNDAACCGITAAQCHALLEIGNNNEISINELALNLGLDNSTLSRTVDSMSRAELVERKINREDRRYLNVILTERGTAVYHSINNTFDAYYIDIFAAIPPGKRLQVIESVRLLVETMAKIGSGQCCLEERNHDQKK